MPLGSCVNFDSIGLSVGCLDMDKKSGEQTLLASVLLSSPGPIVLGVALFYGRSSTQLADFVRRTVELAAIIVSWIVFRIIRKDTTKDPKVKEGLERVANLCVGLAMGLSGVAMLFIALLSSSEDKGTVIPGLIIAFLGVVVNSWFWLRYRRLNRENPDAILAVQSRLYAAKSVVDICVVLALMFVVIAPSRPITGYVDLGGSVVVAIYLMRNGFITIYNKESVTA